jgi:inositol transport system ATP-binding protein
METQNASPLLRLSGLSKSFGHVQVLRDISLSVHRGEVLALMGENGAGKSTLMRILAGLLPAEAGQIEWEGQVIDRAFLSEQVAMIHQETLLVPELSVAENLFLGRELRSGGLWLQSKRMNAQAAELLSRLGASIAPTTRVKDLSIAEKQLVEIAKALGKSARLLILDEPTSALSDQESQQLFKLLATLRSDGVAMLYISHKLDEIFALADRIAVLRDGSLIATQPTTDWDESSLIRAMVGRELGGLFPPPTPDRIGEVVLSVRGLKRPGLGPLSFELRKGEVLGLAGLMGAGRTELLRALYGLDTAQTEQLTLNSHSLMSPSPHRSLRAGLGYLSEDRKQDGLVAQLSIRHNMTLSTLTHHQTNGFLDEPSEKQTVTEQIHRLHIKCQSTEQPIGQLSGGNQQKVLLARVLLTSPSVLLLDEPTRGIDIGAKAEIYALIRSLAQQGMAVLLVSSELPELLGLSDRILVLAEGKQTALLPNTALTQEEVLRHAMP